MSRNDRSTVRDDIIIRPLREEDLGEADRIMRLAFGTFIGLPNPMDFLGDGSYVRERFRANPESAFAAESGGELVGSNFATNWGSVGFFGPLTIRPDCWDRGVGKLLMEPIVELFDRWGTRHAGLFTFAQSQKHVGLYQRYGFWPRFLTAIMARPIEDRDGQVDWHRYSDLGDDDRGTVLDACRALTDEIFDGLDLRLEIESVATQNLGETVLLWEGDRLEGLAVCHTGPGTEAGSGTCYVKFGAVRLGDGADASFDRLLDACEAFGRERGAALLLAGVNTARIEAYRRMLERGFRTQFQGVAMHRPNESGYNRSGIYLIDDWR